MYRPRSAMPQSLLRTDRLPQASEFAGSTTGSDRDSPLDRRDAESGPKARTPNLACLTLFCAASHSTEPRGQTCDALAPDRHDRHLQRPRLPLLRHHANQCPTNDGLARGSPHRGSERCSRGPTELLATVTAPKQCQVCPCGLLTGVSSAGSPLTRSRTGSRRATRPRRRPGRARAERARRSRRTTSSARRTASRARRRRPRRG